MTAPTEEKNAEELLSSQKVTKHCGNMSEERHTHTQKTFKTYALKKNPTALYACYTVELINSDDVKRDHCLTLGID